MNVGILLNNIQELKLFLPLSEILEKKFNTIFFVDHMKSFSSKKVYYIPTKDRLNQHLKKKKIFFSTPRELVFLLKKNNIKKIYAVFWKSYYNLRKNDLKVQWNMVSLGLDTYQRGNLENLNECSRILTTTKYNDISANKFLLRRIDGYSKSKKKILLKKLKKKFIPVGDIGLNNQKILNKKKILKKYKLSNQKKYLLVFLHDTWAYRSDEAVFLMNQNFFQQIFFLFTRPSKKLFKIFFKNIRFKKIFKSIENFAEDMNLKIIIKSRKKSTLPSFIDKNKFKVFYDDFYHPPTTLELINIADVCLLTYTSFSTKECLFYDKPTIVVAPFDERGTKKDLLNFNTKILNRCVYNKHYFSIGKTVLKIHPEKFMTYVKNKKIKNFIKKIFGRKNNLFKKKFIFSKYQNMMKTCDYKKIYN